jgi:PIN domain nuclease of toxin-antitoxin system
MLWLFAGSERIPNELVDELTDPAHDVFFSDVNLLEIVIKYQLGKLPLPRSPSKLLLPLARRHQIEYLPLTAAAIFELEALPLHHRDPFDRLLVAQARTERLTLASPDPKIQRYQVDWRWPEQG